MAHKFPACYTTGQPQPSTDRYVCFLPFVQRSISGLCQLEYPQGPDNPPPGCTGNDFSAIRKCEEAFQATLSPYLQVQKCSKSSRFRDEMIVAGIKSALSKLRFGQCPYLFHSDLLSDGTVDEKSRRIFHFCRRKPSNATAGRFEMFAQRWHFSGKPPSFSHSMPSKASKNASVCSAFSWDCLESS